MTGREGSGRNAASGGRNRGSDQRRSGESDAPANPQEPESNPPDLPAPEERSIGWLDRFFGVQRTDSGPIRAGEGGTGDQPGAGNTNATTATSPEAVASEFTQSNVPQAAVADLDMPPPPRSRPTNRVAAVTNTTLNDNLEQLLRQHRAGSGDVRISLMWNNQNDLDLHVVDPRGEEIYYQHRTAHSGGLLDIDMNASSPLRSPAVENVFWPERGAPVGTYKVFVNHYRQHDRANETAFTVRILVRGRTADFSGTIRFGERKKLVHQFTLGPAGGS